MSTSKMNSQPVQSARTELASPQSKNGRGLILSVDDEPTILYTRQLILEKAGYQVLSAANGEEALLVFSTCAVDLVLLDYSMPGIDGGLAAQEMKRGKRSVPIIIVSATSVPNAIIAHVDDYMTKGESPRVLLKKIDQLLSRNYSDLRGNRMATIPE
jgi:DNA-binding response OmpR family regulator